jgi:histidine ammonia-lyase
MGANAATKCLRVVNNVEKVLAIELMTAAQAMEFRRPLKTSHRLEQMLSDFRNIISFCHEDRIFHDDMIKAVEFVTSYKL